MYLKKNLPTFLRGNLIILCLSNYMIKEAIEMLVDLKLHEKELEAEKKRLEHQACRLDEEIHLLEQAVKQKMEEKKKRLENILQNGQYEEK